MKNIIVPMLLVLKGLSILAYRYVKARECPHLCQTEAGFTVNESFFEEQVVEKNPRIKNSAKHLSVFMDPSRDCAACLLEMDEWVAPLDGTGLYDLTLFMPDSTPPETIESVLGSFGLPNRMVVLYGPEDEISQFHRFGIFKILYSRSHGIEWYDSGSKNESEYHAFAKRLADSLSEVRQKTE